MKFVSNKVIKIGRELSDLDTFTIDFIRILRKHSKYVIVSGYVSILLGRSRASEDIDIIIPKMDYTTFIILLDDIFDNGFYCVNAVKKKDIFDQINEKLAVRFAKMDTVIPNIELKFSKNRIDNTALEGNIMIKLENEELAVSQLELQVAFKEVVLKSPKDIEDARHIMNVAEGHIDRNLIEKYKVILNEFYK